MELVPIEVKRKVKAGRQYIVFHLKLMEVLHLTLLSLHLLDTKTVVGNEMGHSFDRFRETLLGSVVTAFMSIADLPNNKANARTIWKQLHPKHAKLIDRVWERNIAPGEKVMKAYRDQAGAHGDDLARYFQGKLGLYSERAKVMTAMNAFYSLSIRMLNKRQEEVPHLAAEIEAALLDVELGVLGSFNRRWLREMQLIESGPYSKKYY